MCVCVCVFLTRAKGAAPKERMRTPQFTGNYYYYMSPRVIVFIGELDVVLDNHRGARRDTEICAAGKDLIKIYLSLDRREPVI